MSEISPQKSAAPETAARPGGVDLSLKEEQTAQGRQAGDSFIETSTYMHTYTCIHAHTDTYAVHTHIIDSLEKVAAEHSGLQVKEKSGVWGKESSSSFGVRV